MKILKFPNKSLITPTVEVEDLEKVQPLLLSMIETLKQTPSGAALAANQVGLNWRMFVITDALAEQYKIPTAIINPQLKPFGANSVKAQEGCLSFPGIFLEIKRHEAVTCDFIDLSGEKHSVTLEDLGSRVFQHECEHLDGGLYTDNVDRIKRYQVLGRMRRR